MTFLKFWFKEACWLKFWSKGFGLKNFCLDLVDMVILQICICWKCGQFFYKMSIALKRMSVWLANHWALFLDTVEVFVFVTNVWALKLQLLCLLDHLHEELVKILISVLPHITFGDICVFVLTFVFLDREEFFNENEISDLNTQTIPIPRKDKIWLNSLFRIIHERNREHMQLKEKYIMEF